MIAKKMKPLVEGSSVIRAMFEDGKKMAAEVGAENVYDFSLGNPNMPPPEAVREAMISILQNTPAMQIHGYMNNSGFESVRETIAASLNRRFGTAFHGGNIVMTVGAAGGLNVALKALLDPGDEVVVFAPYFGEYRSYVGNYDGVLVTVSPQLPDFQPNLAELAEKLTPKTKAVIVNTPNNPTGVIYSEETIVALADILTRKGKEFGTDIYLISDEPYRELAYDGAQVPYLTKYYPNTIVGYSYSKSLSLPGERIGYLVIPDEVADGANLRTAANVVTRTLGFVNAPALQQLTIAACIDLVPNIEGYNRNRETLYNGLLAAGYRCAKPEGAFYLFVESPLPDDREFCQRAKAHHLLTVPGSAFGCPGYFRLAYCVSHEMIERALPAFAAVLAEITAER